MEKIKHETRAGSSVDAIAKTITKIAQGRRCIVEADFNGILLTARPYTTCAADIVGYYWAECFKRSDDAKRRTLTLKFDTNEMRHAFIEWITTTDAGAHLMDYTEKHGNITDNQYASFVHDPSCDTIKITSNEK